jgi:hypothetical protein
MPYPLQNTLFPPHEGHIFPFFKQYFDQKSSKSSHDMFVPASSSTSYSSPQATDFIKRNIVVSSGFVGGFLLGLAS